MSKSARTWICIQLLIRFSLLTPSANGALQQIFAMKIYEHLLTHLACSSLHTSCSRAACLRVWSTWRRFPGQTTRKRRWRRSWGSCNWRVWAWLPMWWSGALALRIPTLRTSSFGSCNPSRKVPTPHNPRFFSSFIVTLLTHAGGVSWVNSVAQRGAACWYLFAYGPESENKQKVLHFNLFNNVVIEPPSACRSPFLSKLGNLTVPLAVTCVEKENLYWSLVRCHRR